MYFAFTMHFHAMLFYRFPSHSSHPFRRIFRSDFHLGNDQTGQFSFNLFAFLQSTDPNLLFTYFSKHSFILLRIIKNIYLNFNWPIDSDTLLYHNVVIKLFKCRYIIKEKINIQKEINLFFDDARSIGRELKREKKKGGQKKKKTILE